MTEDRKNICFNKNCNVYLVKFAKHGELFQTSMSSLEEAIELHDKVRDFIVEHDRIPTFEEVGYIRRVKKDIPTKANKLGNRNISFDRRMNRYVVRITRRGEMFNCLADSLEKRFLLRKQF